MSFLNKVGETITEKLQSSLNELSAASEQKMKRNPLSGDLFGHMGEAISKKMSGHFNNILQHFTSDTHPQALLEQIGDQIGHKQTQAMEGLMQNLEKKKPLQLDYDYQRDVKKELAEKEEKRQEQEQRERNNQKIEESQIQNPASPVQHGQKTPISTIKETQQNMKVEMAHSELQTPLKAHSQIEIERQNPQKSAFIKSELIQKRDIVKQLQLRRQLTLERERKSQKMKSRLIKLQPLARQKEQQIKEKQTREKLSDALEFFNSIQLSKQITNHKPTEWRQQRTVPTYTPTKSNEQSIVSKLRYSNKKKLQQLGFSPVRINRNSIVTSKNKQRSRSRQESFVLPKPLPYNLYTINQTKNEVFQLKLI